MKKLILISILASITSLYACKADITKKECQDHTKIWNTNPSIFLDRNISIQDIQECCDTNKTK